MLEDRGSVKGDAFHPTFKALMAEGKSRASRGEVAAPAMASSTAALRNFMRAHGRVDDDPFAPLMGSSDNDFAPVLQAFEDRAAVSARTIASYRSRLRTWNAMARTVLERRAPGLLCDVLASALDRHKSKFPGSSNVSVARQAGMCRTMLKQWADPGALRPTATAMNLARAARLEQVLELLPGILASGLVSLTRKVKSQALLAKERKARSDTISTRVVRFRPDCLPPRLDDFLGRMTALKTTARILHNKGGQSLRRSKTKWRVLPGAKGRPETATLIRDRLRTYVGWLTLPKTIEGARAHVLANCSWKHKRLDPADAERLAPYFVGKGIPFDGITPAHAVDPELLGEFIEWQKSRTGRAQGGHLADALAFLAPRTGFLTQQVEYVWGYASTGIRAIDPAGPQGKRQYDAASKQWAEKSSVWSDEIKGLQSFVAVGKGQGARDRLKPILDQKDLMGVVLGIVDAHAADRPIGKLEQGWSGAVHLAVWVRNQLLLRMLASNPLRNRNYREMRYAADNKGNLYRAADGGWRLRFQPHEFKNEAGAAKEPYDVPVAKDIWPLVELYLFRARPIMKPSPSTDAVFLNRHGRAFDKLGLSSVICNLTGRYIRADIETLGIRTHAFRHIVATAWLRAHPKDYLTVAHILHDTLHTVLANYAHLKASDGLEPYTDWLATQVTPFRFVEAA